MELKKIMKRGMHAVADLILPRVCDVCGDRLLLGERHICLHCLADMPLTRFWDMKHNPMADRFNAAIQTSLVEERESGHDGQTCRHERYERIENQHHDRRIQKRHNQPDIGFTELFHQMMRTSFVGSSSESRWLSVPMNARTTTITSSDSVAPKCQSLDLPN